MKHISEEEEEEKWREEKWREEKGEGRKERNLIKKKSVGAVKSNTNELPSRLYRQFTPEQPRRRGKEECFLFGLLEGKSGKSLHSGERFCRELCPHVVRPCDADDVARRDGDVPLARCGAVRGGVSRRAARRGSVPYLCRGSRARPERGGRPPGGVSVHRAGPASWRRGVAAFAGGSNYLR